MTKTQQKGIWAVIITALGGIVVTSIKTCSHKESGGGQSIQARDVGGSIFQGAGPITVNEAPDPFESIQPRLLTPYDGTIFDDYPRHVNLEWKTVPKATGYEVEVQWQLPDDKSWHTVRDYPKAVNVPTYSFDFVGAQPGRWRVVATTKDGKRSSWSDWRSFSFTR